MMRSVNMDFLFRQKQAGKQFWFSHDLFVQLSAQRFINSTYTYGLRYLEQI